MHARNYLEKKEITEKDVLVKFSLSQSCSTSGIRGGLTVFLKVATSGSSITAVFELGPSAFHLDTTSTTSGRGA